MTNENLTQKVLSDADKNQEKPRNKSKGLSNYVKVPVVTMGMLGSLWLGTLGVCKYQEVNAHKVYAQKQVKQEESRQERVLRIAQYKEEEPSQTEQIFTTLFNGDYSYARSLTSNERKFVEQYRQDHPEYTPENMRPKAESPKSYQPKSAEEQRKEQEKIEFMEKSIRNYREAHK